MYKRKSILALIPARGGSKGVPGKNIRILGDKPMIAWTIDTAKQSKYIDRLILSSEDQEIISTSRKYSCEVPFIRPTELADDETPGIEPVLHALSALDMEYDYLVLLQPTSPFRSVEDIDCAIEKCIDSAAASCVSVSESAKHPAWMYEIDEAGFLYPFLNSDKTADRRQELSPVHSLNGAVYVVKTTQLMEHKSFVFENSTVAHSMPPDRSMDVDTQFDFLLCDLLADRIKSGLLKFSG